MQAKEQADGTFTIFDGDGDFVRGDLTRSEAEYWLEGWSYALHDRESIGPTSHIECLSGERVEC